MEPNTIPKDVLPTLVIGLGGTGFQIIKRMKQLFKKRYNGAKLPIRYLLIDTDLKSFLDDAIENNEKCQLTFGDGIKNTLNWAYQNPNFDWLPKNPEITPDFFTATDQGAGLIRPIGRLYLCKNAKLVYDALSSARNDLVDLYKVLIDMGGEYLENIDRHKVYIAGSLAGGTGCGTFLDVGVMVSKIFNRDNTNVIGLFTLESCYDEKLSSDLDAQSRSKANCYAALKELEFYMSPVKRSEGEKYLFKYNNVGEIKLEKKLFDICYLLENKNEMGGMLTNIEDIYDLCSLQLFQEIGTPLGSQLRADYANFLCKDRDPQLQRERHFSTFSSSSLVFPLENLKSYCSLRLAGDILHKLSSSLDIARLELEADKNYLIGIIDEKLDFNNITEDLTRTLKIRNDIKYSELKESKLGNLKKTSDSIRSQRVIWEQNRRGAQREIEAGVDNFIENRIGSYGIGTIINLLKELETYYYDQRSIYEFETKYDSGTIKSRINNIVDKKVTRERVSVPGDIIRDFNGYIAQEYNNFLCKVEEDRHLLIREIINRKVEKLQAFLGRIGDMKQNISERLERMNLCKEKKYGGSIISREVVSQDYYDEVYWKKYGQGLENRISVMFRGNSLTSSIEAGLDAFHRMCLEYFERTYEPKTITEILMENAGRASAGVNEYVKNELDITSKLAKPFWSAVKNPEVSWTECYYVGAVRDAANDNGFTVKPPEVIDRWIRNQMGERSRQARYVETWDPNSIDVIHIVMGACAAYLPDVKTYKQFYLKLLASSAYPLHLDEKYVGLGEIEPELEKMFINYSLARAFGIIFEKDNNLYMNARIEDERYKYVYVTEAMVRDEEFYSKSIMQIPENPSQIKEGLKLGNSCAEIIYKINQDISLYTQITEFIGDIEKKFSKEDITGHIRKYIKSKVSKDYISNEKIVHSILAN